MGRTVRLTGGTPARDCPHEFWGNQVASSDPSGKQQQKGKCPWCGLSFQDWDVVEEDHKIPKALGGKDEYKNLQLLHRHCHDEKTAIDLKEIRRKNQLKFLKKLSQFWEKFEWNWINDIPNFIKQKVRKPDVTNG